MGQFSLRLQIYNQTLHIAWWVLTQNLNNVQQLQDLEPLWEQQIGAWLLLVQPLVWEGTYPGLR